MVSFRASFRAWLGTIICALCAASASAISQEMTSIDAPVATFALPYAQMSESAYGAIPVSGGWTPIANWQTIFIDGGRADLIPQAEASGFSAEVFKNTRDGDITIAYRGTVLTPADLGTDLAGLQGKLPDQFRFARELAILVGKKFPSANITATGHSLGGALATYAGQLVPRVSNVVAFNPARFGIINGPTQAIQTNVPVPSDGVGDPRTGSALGLLSLPGKTYYVQSTTANAAAAPTNMSALEGKWDNSDTHALLGIIGGLCNASSSSSCAHSQQATATKGANSAPSTKLPVTSWSPPVSSAPAPQVHQAVPRQSTVTAPRYQSPPTTFGARYTSTTASPMLPSIMPAVYRPGGISLNKAAAERMSLNIDLEGLHYSNGQIVLAGWPSTDSGIDAALFLTTLRLACESTDPIFSLDPDNPEGWSVQGQALAKAIWESAKHDYEFTPNMPANRGRNATIPDGLTLQTLSARRDFPALLAKMAPLSPDMKARLVFHPEWLRQTRVGAILYRADVLLKELSAGVSLLSPDAQLRAALVGGYVAANLRRNIEAPFNAMSTPGVINSSRLWFDLIPQNVANADPAPATLPVLDRSRNPSLYSVLERRGLLAPRTPMVVDNSAFFTNGSSIDLSKVYPKMFVRRRDPIANQDLPGTDAYLSLLAYDINERTDRYVAAYRELRDLTAVFRAYVANVAIVRQDRTACDSVGGMALYDAEKVSTPLPEFHLSEVFVYVMRYVTQQGRKRLLWLNSGNATSGGIALRAQQFYDDSVVAMETQLISDLDRELAKPPSVAKSNWTGESGRNFILINLRDDRSRTDTTRLTGGGASITRSANHTFGSDSYKMFAGTRYDQCEQMCLKEKTCMALAFQKPDNKCDLFDSVGVSQPNPLSDIGVKQAGASP